MSKLETMAYKMQPAGHEEPPKRRKYEKPPSKLRKAFESWFTFETPYDEMRDRDFKQYYELALKLTENLEIRLDDAHALLISYQDHPNITSAGLFVSAIYNKIADEEIVFDLPLDVHINNLGYKLAEGKLLISKADTGNALGRASLAPVINYGQSGFQMGHSSKAPVINFGICMNRMGDYAKNSIVNLGVCRYESGNFRYSELAINFGTCGPQFGWESKKLIINCGKAEYTFAPGMVEGLIIAIEDPESFASFAYKNASKLLKAEDCMKIPELVKYVQDLKERLEKGRTDYKAIKDVVQELSQPKVIRSNIEAILRGHGYDV